MRRPALFMMVSLIAAVSVFSQNSAASSGKLFSAADSLFRALSWKLAAESYQKALVKEPGNALALNRLGFSCQNLGQYDRAIENYIKALQKKPPQPMEVVIQSRLARAYAKTDQKDKSFAALNRALDLGYSNVIELETHAEFESIRKEVQFADVVKRATNNSYPCMGDAKVREFDFWIGEWDAYVTGTSNLAGRSKIEMASGGCMILESWTSAGAPFNGKSMNFVDPSTGKWKQVWIGSGGRNVTEFLNGEYRDGAMRFEFESTNPQGARVSTHFYFFNQSPDQVRQFNETSQDGGKTWVTTYDFTYKRLKQSP